MSGGIVATETAARRDAIRRARTSMLTLEAMIEAAINADPRRFEPAEAHKLRSEFEALTHVVDDALGMLSEFTDLDRQLNVALASLKSSKESNDALRTDKRNLEVQLANAKAAIDRAG